MAKSATTAKPTPKSKFSTILHARKQALVTFGTALGGFAAGVPVALAFMLSSASPVATRVVQVTPASDDLSCGQASVSSASAPAAGGQGGGQVLGEETSNPPAGGQGGGGNNQTPPPFIQTVLNANGSITGPTGPGSTNTVTSNQTVTNTVTNNNNLNVSNSNWQSANSGNANVSGNTNGGSANSGDTSNTNSTDIDVNVSNN